MQGQYNMRSPAVKRLMKEAQELREPTELYHAQPLEDNLFEWHFTLRGPEDSDFDNGIYHGRIVLPPEYPMKPPSIILLTPNGRFETFKKICLSISGHHPESWQPSWSIRTALLAIIGFMPTHGGGAIGSLDYTTEERKVLAKKSQDWKCAECGDVSKNLKPVTKASQKASLEAKELASQINFQGEKAGGTTADTSEANKTSAAATASPPAAAAATTAPPPVPPPVPFPWVMSPHAAWGSFPPSLNNGMTGVPRFPYPPPPMMPPPVAGGPGMPFYPPLPFFPPMMRGFMPFPFPSGFPVNAAPVPGSPVATPTGISQTAPAFPSPSPSPASSVPLTSLSSSAAQQTPTASSSTSSNAPSAPATVGAAASGGTADNISSSESTAAIPGTCTSTTVASAATDTELRRRAVAAPAVVSSAEPASTSAAAAAAVAGTSSAATPAASAGGATAAARTNSTNHPAESPVNHFLRCYSPSTILLMFLLVLAISFLLARRIYLQLFHDFWGHVF